MWSGIYRYQIQNNPMNLFIYFFLFKPVSRQNLSEMPDLLFIIFIDPIPHKSNMHSTKSWLCHIPLTWVKGTLSRTFFGFFSKMALKLRLSTFNHAGNAPRT